MTWPYPGDSPVARARRVALAYRTVLLQVDEAACRALDERMFGWGQSWVAPQIAVVQPDDWLPSTLAADLAGVEAATVRRWRLRGRIEGRWRAGRWEYRAGDVIAVLAAIRRRRPR